MTARDGKAWRRVARGDDRPRCTAWARTRGRRCQASPLPTFETCGMHTSMAMIRDRLAELTAAGAPA